MTGDRNEGFKITGVEWVGGKNRVSCSYGPPRNVCTGRWNNFINLMTCRVGRVRDRKLERGNRPRPANILSTFAGTDV